MTIVAYLEFRSKVDRWVVWLVFGLCVFMTAVGLWVLVTDSSDAITKVILSLTTTITLPFMLWILFGTRYRLTEDYLLVRSGPFSQKIYVDTITSVEPVCSLQSGHALSRDRFLIRYDRFSTVMISPEDRGRFLQEVASRASHLVWQDEKLVTYS